MTMSELMHAGNPEPGCCVNCGAQRDGGQLEVINPLGNRACANTVACELRGLGIDPAEHLIVVARAVGKDLAGLSEHDLAAGPRRRGAGAGAAGLRPAPAGHPRRPAVHRAVHPRGVAAQRCRRDRPAGRSGVGRDRFRRRGHV